MRILLFLLLTLSGGSLNQNESSNDSSSHSGSLDGMIFSRASKKTHKSNRLGGCEQNHKVEGFKECLELAEKYLITESNFTLMTFETMTRGAFSRWEQNLCVYQFANQLICQRVPINCTDSQQAMDSDSNLTLPIVAIVAATTTRHLENVQMANLPIFRLMFPSLARTLECGYQYIFVLGYDTNDSFYSNSQVLSFYDLPIFL
jgi:hypothetical protein